MKVSLEEEEAYEFYLQELMMSRLRTMALCAIPILPMMIVGGYFFEPGGRIFVRIVFGAASFGLLAGLIVFLSFQSWFLNYAYRFATATYIIVLLSVTVVIATGELAQTGGLSRVGNYISGFAAAYLIVVVLLPFQFVIACLSIALGFACVSFGLVWSEIPRVDVIIHIILFMVLCCMLVVLSYTVNKSRKNEFITNVRLDAEKQRSDKLLLNVLPVSIAERLKQGQIRIADNHGEVSVLFADLVGFTQMSSQMLPSNVVEIIDDIFTRFDDIMEIHGMEKIKTVGDEYMAVAGVPLELKEHAQHAAAAALDLKASLNQFNEEMEESLDLRIGIHSGPLVAGVIGTKKMSYDVWGDTVNTASRMESHSENGRIHVSETTYHLLRKDFELELRGDIEVKGKGTMQTYYLLGPRT